MSRYEKERPHSHLETVWRTTFSLTASSPWDRPLDSLILRMFSLSMATPDLRGPPVTRHSRRPLPVAASNAR